MVKLILVMIAVLFIIGCGQQYRPSIIDIRNEPTPIDWSPRQPEKFARTILEFKP